MPDYAMFAVTAPGLESLAAAELRAVGAKQVRAEEGGVGFTGGRETLYAANLWLRTANRVLVRVAEFHASEFHELERRARRVPWERHVAPGRPVRFRVTCRKSKLYHSDAVAQRFAGAVAATLGDGALARPAPASGAADQDDEGDDAQLFVVRIAHDECTVSADSSGALLHQRGYRQAVARAPLRETLAAAMLMAAGWPPATPLVDPMCGSGTIGIEAALLARRLAPGRQRGFAFLRWPDADASAWAELLARAEEGVLSAAGAPILCSDRDAGAIAATRANAERAGVSADIDARQGAISTVPAQGGPGWLITNPPYGVRLGERAALRDLYAQLGHVARAALPGWTIALLSADRALASHLRLPLEPRMATSNGGIPVELLVGRVPAH